MTRKREMICASVWHSVLSPRCSEQLGHHRHHERTSGEGRSACARGGGGGAAGRRRGGGRRGGAARRRRGDVAGGVGMEGIGAPGTRATPLAVVATLLALDAAAPVTFDLGCGLAMRVR